MGKGKKRGLQLLAVTVGFVGLSAAISLGFVPAPIAAGPSGFRSMNDLRMAYDKVVTGRTTASALRDLGFDTTAPNVESLSYLGLVERYMPHNSMAFDNLDAAIQSCLQAEDRCTAMIVRPAGAVVRGGAGVLASLGLSREVAAGKLSDSVTLLVRDGRVTYKMIDHAGR